MDNINKLKQSIKSTVLPHLNDSSLRVIKYKDKLDIVIISDNYMQDIEVSFEQLKDDKNIPIIVNDLKAKLNIKNVKPKKKK